MATLPLAPPTGHLPPTHRHFELFDSLRAIAALSVLVFHSAGWAGVNLFAPYGAFTAKLHVGVTLFFLISGFLLYRPHAVEILGGPAAPPLRDYALRRAFRILPAYWVALTLLALWPGLSGVFTRNWWVYYGLLQSYRQAWSMRGIGVAWSLSVEASFYLLLPLLARALARVGRRLDPERRVRLQLLTFAALALGSLAFRAAIHRAGVLDLYTSLPANLVGFLVGMAVAVVSVWLEGRERSSWAARFVADRPGWCWALAAVPFCAVSLSPAFPRPFSGEDQPTLAYTAESAIYSSIGLLVMLPAVFGDGEGGLSRRLLGSRPLSWIGKVSYGIFLWHLPLLGLLKQSFFAGGAMLPTFLWLTALSVPAAIGLGWLSWHFVELPALRLASLLGARGILGAMGRNERVGRSGPP